jgi:hypothetical protein
MKKTITFLIAIFIASTLAAQTANTWKYVINANGGISITPPLSIGGVAMTTTGTKLNYLTSASGTTGTTSTSIVFSTSPELTTPTVVTSIVGGATFSAFNTISTNLSVGGAATTLTVGGTPTTSITHSYSANVTANAATKTVNIGSGGASGSTTNINIGSSNGGTTTVNSPTLALGAGSITMTGSIGGNGSPVTKGWFTDVSSTNMPTVGENSLTTIFAALRPDSVQHTANYTVATSDIYKDQMCLKATSIIITIPLNLSTWPIGAWMNFLGEGAGIMVFKKASGVRLVTPLDSIASFGKGDMISIKKIGTNAYMGTGNLTN